jgi:O-methyltransferase
MFNDIDVRLKQKIKERFIFNTDKFIIDKVEPYTFCSKDKLKSLIQLCNYINFQKIPGDLVECGTYKGGSAAVISRYLGKDRHLWLYDSFEGMPETSNKDGEKAKEYVGKGVASEDDVYEILKLVGTNLDKITIKKGFFHNSFTEEIPEQIAFLHCDADWYESVMLVLRTFYHRIPDGGVIVLDDFGYWEGCREAFYDFCKEYDIKPLVERVSSDQLFWYKGKTSNR